MGPDSVGCVLEKEIEKVQREEGKRKMTNSKEKEVTCRNCGLVLKFNKEIADQELAPDCIHKCPICGTRIPKEV